MENSNERLTCEQARNFDLVDYLASLGHHPKKVQANNHWYLSPFREERTPSFRVNRKLNVWADFGDAVPPGKKVSGGNLIDFAVRYHRCTVSEFLISMQSQQGLPMFAKAERKTLTKEELEKDKITILKDIQLSHPALLTYLQSRRISYQLATEHCREVHFRLHDRPYFAIGFKNDAGGYELRNAHFKGSSSPKGFTHIHAEQQAPGVAVFEGFFSYLSYLSLVPQCEREDRDSVVLNSLVFFESARPVLESYKTVDLFLDNNAPGKRITDYARSLDRRLYKDKSHTYKNYDDFNHLHCHFGESKKKGKKLLP
ncbi:toprim domain-containing protein [Chitinophaga sp. CC14]|uniref:toprim domain-containing protein n=1 Tax=Chitinophaga sp. CC14 TaxID=3029199 RepID=UPI003B7F3E2B